MSNVGPIAHSDGDAVMHAVTDAILSAVGQRTIWVPFFLILMSENKERDSKEFLIEAMDRINSGGWAIGNIDITVLCDEPKIAPP